MKKNIFIFFVVKVVSTNFMAVFFILITMIIMPGSLIHAQPCYKEGEGYLLKEVDSSAPFFFNRYKYGQMGSYYYKFYIVAEEALLEFFNNDSVKWNKAILLCDPALVMFSDSTISRDIRRYTRIKDILALDDSEIYKIGSKKFFIRKIRYAYYDNSQVNVYIRGYNHFQWDDISEDEEDILNATYEVGQLYEINYYQCYHHLIELLPTPPQISGHIWKRLYQLGEEENEE